MMLTFVKIMLKMFHLACVKLFSLTSMSNLCFQFPHHKNTLFPLSVIVSVLNNQVILLSLCLLQVNLLKHNMKPLTYLYACSSKLILHA